MNQKSVYKVLGVTTLFLSGCATMTPQRVNDMANEANSQKSELINQLNHLFDLEANLQNQFEETLANDPEMDSISEGSSQVIENIEQRQDTIEEIEGLNNDLQGNAESFINYEEEELDQASVNSLGENIQSFNQMLDEYINNYTTSLDTQRQYFESISQDDATIEDFTQGIDTVNQEHKELAQQATNLEEPLNEIDAQLLQLINQTEQHLEGENENGE